MRAATVVRAYEVGVKGQEWTRTVVYALSAGKAKYDYLLDVRESWPDVTFKHITCRAGGPFEPLRLRRTAADRGLPFVHARMQVEVEGHSGVVVDSNDSANFDVLFVEGPHAGLTLNCHPTWQTKYFGDDGAVLADFTGGK